jgi:hypothetical protein
MSMRKSLLFILGLAGIGYAGFRAFVEPWWRSWGFDPSEADRILEGDEMVPDATHFETRGITIAAPPERVWPWLVQMGFGRAGWYSYDQVDMRHRSAERIVPEWQSLAEGDLVPTHPAGGFVAKRIVPQRALVLYLDDEMVKSWEKASADPTPANLAAAGAFMSAAQPPEFSATWAFVLQPVGTDRTRLIERFRIRFGEARPWNRVGVPLMGFGLFLMLRKQLLGIQARAERPEPAAAPVEVAPGNVPIEEAPASA